MSLKLGVYRLYFNFHYNNEVLINSFAPNTMQRTSIVFIYKENLLTRQIN